MQFRKRLWADDEPADSPKPTSPPQLTNRQQTHTLLGYISKAQIFDTTRTIETKRCIHKDAASCAMDMSLCCGCADKRPTALRYSRYVDGMEMTMEGMRWQYYCPGCKTYWSQQVWAGNELKGPLHVSGEDIVLTFKAEHNRAVERIVTSDLTAGSLKSGIAALLPCDTSELVLEADGIELAESHLFEHGLFLGTTIEIYCGRIEAEESDYDMMDGVQYVEKEVEYYEHSHRKRPRHK